VSCGGNADGETNPDAWVACRELIGIISQQHLEIPKYQLQAQQGRRQACSEATKPDAGGESADAGSKTKRALGRRGG
jgi:hypothetical protein